MSSHRQILYQLVFCTKGRARTISTANAEELYKYIWGVVKHKDCVLYCINSMEEHVHLLTDLHPSLALADYVKDIKVASSKWMKESGLFPTFDGWADGYGAFTYSAKEKDAVISYIKNQQQHHKEFDFYAELKQLLAEHGVSYDERYML